MSQKFGERVRELREHSRITLRQLGKALECSAVYLSDVELGHRAPPSPERIVKIAKIIGADENELLRLAAQQRKHIELDTEGLHDLQLDAALSLGRALKGLTDDQAEQILKVLRGKPKDDDE